jgi:hypothetical protein
MIFHLEFSYLILYLDHAHESSLAVDKAGATAFMQEDLKNTFFLGFNAA